MGWLSWRPKTWAIGWSWPISRPDASRDVCLKAGCGIQRRFHDGLSHEFVEED